LFLIATSIIFLDLSGKITGALSSEITFLQFIPSLLKFIDLPSLVTIGCVVILILTLLFGRIYCSSVCPIGTLQDIIIFLKRRKKKKVKYKFEYYKPLNFVRYAIFGSTILTFLLGSMYLIILLDPFSNFGRIMQNLMKPIVIGGNNFLVIILEYFDTYTLAPFTFKGIDYFTSIYSIFLISLIIWLAVKNGRLFCNSVCPLGTFLGLISRLAVFKIAVNEITCTDCGLCEKVCKSNCIDSDTKYVDFSRCVSCFNCFDICPSVGLKYELPFANKPKNENVTVTIPNDRREFLSGLISYSLALTTYSVAQNKIEVYKKNTIQVYRHNPITPPGSLGIEHMSDYCTACHLCVSVCPSQVLQPSFLEYGFLGMMTPRLDNKIGFCDYICVKCTEVCPSGAIRKISEDEKKLIQIGKVKFIEDNCVVKTQGTACGACSEHCPTKAVSMIPYEGNLNLKIPTLKEEICVGCGACEYACPTIPYKAIYVASNNVHQVAELPKIEKIDEEINLKEDFPF
jgi:ferredoxin